MSTRSSHPRVVARALLATAAGLAVGLVGPVAASSAQARSTDDLHCAATSLAQPVRLGEAFRSGLSGALVRGRNELTSGELQHLVADDTSWVDPCGDVFVVDEAAPPTQQSAAAPTPSAGLPADVFDLSSRPGSDRTVYLDFDGSTYAGTAWRKGETIVSPAFSVDDDPTTFSETERAQVYLAWQVVAEDLAPFDVDVTTREPAPAALTRTSAADPTYGMPVVVTATNSVGSGCACGGMAYVGVLGKVGANGHQPAWVFTQGSGTNGYNVGQAISHEVGHTFGLHHDGTSTTSYYAGAKGWAPIMGASYNRRASQWSRGEYPDASNTEDDVAIIATVAPVVADDHADSAVGATAIAPGSSVAGLIGTRADVDAFSFTAGGPVTLSVAGPAGWSDLDVRLTVVDDLGQTVATVDPTADSATDDSLAAVWSADLPGTATWTALVDGTGHGDPAEAGRYSDYGSIGRYTLTLAADSPTTTPPTTTPPTTTPPATTPPATTPPTSPPTTTTPAPPTPATPALPASPVTGGPAAGDPARFVTTTLPRARSGRTYRAAIRFTGSVSEARIVRRLPAGLTWRATRHRIVIRGTVRARRTSRVTAVLSGADGATRTTFRLVVR